MDWWGIFTSQVVAPIFHQPHAWTCHNIGILFLHNVLWRHHLSKPSQNSHKSIWINKTFTKKELQSGVKYIHLFFVEHVWIELGHTETQEVTWELQKDLSHTHTQTEWVILKNADFYTSQEVRNTSVKQDLSVKLPKRTKVLFPCRYDDPHGLYDHN